ncbi:MAG: alpha amylase C-terminal domain-containing protein, partial [Oscillospiraceae bacterium]|nr:alpha amylase C-terminal domain-containing protein [Oscillospiraceae bacterium]
DNANSVIVFRRINKAGEELIVVCNFQPKSHPEYTFGVPFKEAYSEVFSTLGKATNRKKKPKPVPMHGEPYSLTVEIKPMSAMFFKREAPKPVSKSPKATTKASKNTKTGKKV